MDIDIKIQDLINMDSDSYLMTLTKSHARRSKELELENWIVFRCCGSGARRGCKFVQFHRWSLVVQLQYHENLAHPDHWEPRCSKYVQDLEVLTDVSCIKKYPFRQNPIPNKLLSTRQPSPRKYPLGTALRPSAPANLLQRQNRWFRCKSMPRTGTRTVEYRETLNDESQ
jgi:hypothetical protein